MTQDEALQLVDYNYWARDRILAAVSALSAEQYTRDLGSSFGSVRDTLVHIYSAEWIWNMRWTGISPTSAIDAEQFADREALRAAWAVLEHEIRTFVQHTTDDRLAQQIDYKLLNGTASRATFAQMLRHVVNHGSYHRGQVTTLLRQLGGVPPQSVDLITYFREQKPLLEHDA